MPCLNGIFIYHRTASPCCLFHHRRRRRLIFRSVLCAACVIADTVCILCVYILQLQPRYSGQTKKKKYVKMVFTSFWRNREEQEWKRLVIVPNNAICVYTLIRIEIDTKRKSIESGHFEHVSIAARFYKCQFNGNLQAKKQSMYPVYVCVRFHELLKYLPTSQREWNGERETEPSEEKKDFSTHTVVSIKRKNGNTKN